jgi:general stress protein YciG
MPTEYLKCESKEINMASTKSTKSGGESKRGFASMDEDKQREIASKGGKAAHEKGTAHEFDSEEARAAGRKGGEASRGGRRGGSGSHSLSSRGGSSAQHAKAGSQSHKNN